MGTIKQYSHSYHITVRDKGDTAYQKVTSYTQDTIFSICFYHTAVMSEEQRGANSYSTVNTPNVFPPSLV